MRGKISPTIIERYVDRYWWMKNGGGYGMLPDGSHMTETYHFFDHEGYDQFGYDSTGRDRAGHGLRDYEADDGLFTHVAGEAERYRARGRSAGDYWPALVAVSEALAARFPQVVVLDPQDPPVVPSIRRFLASGGYYGVRLALDPEAGHERSLEIRFDDGAGGSSRLSDGWTVNAVARAGGETRQCALCFMDTRETVIAEALSFVAAFDPDRELHSIHVMEDGDGSIRLLAVPHGSAQPRGGDRLGSAYGSDPETAIMTFIADKEPGGPIHRMGIRGIERLRRDARHQHPATNASGAIVADQAEFFNFADASP
jgi:hypothetical protein